MILTCWVCQRAIEPGEAQVAARGLPRRLRRYDGQPMHLRCHGEWKDAAVSDRQPEPAATAAPAPPAHRTSAALLFAEDLARRNGISRWQARRLLVQLEQTYGTSVVGRLKGRRGPRRYTTEAALEAVTPRVARSDVVERLAALEQQVEFLREQGA